MRAMENYLVVQSNDIIEASYCLSVNEQRLLLACISQVDSRKNANFDFTKGVSLTVEQAQDLFYTEKNRQNAYYDLKTACEKIYRREVKLQSENGRFERLLRWVSSVDFDNEEMRSTLYFSREIQPYISELSNNFTEYRIRNIVQLSSKYAIRIYEIIVSWYGQNCSYKEIEITEFRELLDLGKKYKQHGELNRYVVKPALREINDYTDFEMEVSFKKRGRSFRWIQLRFNRKKDAVIAEEERKTASEKRRILNEGAKMKRLAKEAHTSTEIALNEALKNFEGLPEGMMLKAPDGDLWRVDATIGALYCDKKRVVMSKTESAQRIASGYFTQVNDVIEKN